MFAWLRKLFPKPNRQALRGTPAVRREKTYSAETGYVYRYFYEGYRDAERGHLAGHEHIFSVSSDRTSRFPVVVFLSRQALEPWEAVNNRELIPTEQYAIVKLSLFQAFDNRTGFDGGAVEVIISAENVEEHIATLDL